MKIVPVKTFQDAVDYLKNYNKKAVLSIADKTAFFIKDIWQLMIVYFQVNQEERLRR